MFEKQDGGHVINVTMQGYWSRVNYSWIMDQLFMNNGNKNWNQKTRKHKRLKKLFEEERKF